MLLDRRLRIALRALGAALVAAWFLSPAVRAAVPFWLPFAILLGGELEYLVRGLLELRRGPAGAGDGPRGAPDAIDADLGWGALVEEVDEAGAPLLDENGAPVVRRLPPPSRPPRPRRWPLAVGAAVAVALLVLAYRTDRRASWAGLAAADRAAAEARLTEEAGRIAGRPVRVVCDDGYAYTGLGSDALGVAFLDRGLAYLRPSVCRTLRDAIAGSRPVSDDAGEAVLVLAHEAVHLRGERREGVTECLGLQEGVGLARRLGWSRAEAERLMRRRYEAVRADRGITRLSYALPAGCRDGGDLDVRPDHPGFP